MIVKENKYCGLFSALKTITVSNTEMECYIT